MLFQDISLTGGKTRSISPENRSGDKGMGGTVTLEQGTAASAARELGTGWKVNPFINIGAGETVTLADTRAEGAITHIWMTPTGNWRHQILRFYWDDSTVPSIECPMGDFFASGWGVYAPVHSLAVCVNPGSAFNCYWRMPFRKGFRITLENLCGKPVRLYYQITYDLCAVPPSAGYLHAHFHRVNPLPYKEVFTVLDRVRGTGQYVGTYMAWGVHNNGWWGEGEIKFYMDGDEAYPTICGTGTEDYFCGSYDFEDPQTHDRYVSFTTPYSGLPTVLTPDTLYKSQMRFGMYRWHITDPIRFESDLMVTIQALGWRSDGRYLPLQDDIAAVAFFYLNNTDHAPPALPDRDALEII